MRPGVHGTTDTPSMLNDPHMMCCHYVSTIVPCSLKIDLRGVCGTRRTQGPTQRVPVANREARELPQPLVGVFLVRASSVARFARHTLGTQWWSAWSASSIACVPAEQLHFGLPFFKIGLPMRPKSTYQIEAEVGVTACLASTVGVRGIRTPGEESATQHMGHIGAGCFFGE